MTYKSPKTRSRQILSRSNWVFQNDNYFMWKLHTKYHTVVWLITASLQVCRAQFAAPMKCILTTFASFANVRFSNNTSMSYEVILKTECQREITKVAARGTTLLLDLDWSVGSLLDLNFSRSRSMNLLQYAKNQLLLTRIFDRSLWK